MLLGGAFQLLIQVPTLSKTGFRFHFVFAPRDSGLRRILLLMLPATIGLSATQLNIFINTNFAASCGQGAMSWLNYAFRLVQLPIGVFGVALSIAIMPVLARKTAKKDLNSLKQTFTSSLVLVLALALPATAGLVLLAGREACARLLLQLPAGDSAPSRARDLAYHLFTLADQKGWTQEALVYNALINEWTDIQDTLAELRRQKPQQGGLF